jgi:hypothetical protein
MRDGNVGIIRSPVRAIALAGDYLEYEEQYWGARVRAVKVRPIVSPRIRAANRPWAEACVVPQKRLGGGNERSNESA